MDRMKYPGVLKITVDKGLIFELAGLIVTREYFCEFVSITNSFYIVYRESDYRESCQIQFRLDSGYQYNNCIFSLERIDFLLCTNLSNDFKCLVNFIQNKQRLLQKFSNKIDKCI